MGDVLVLCYHGVSESWPWSSAVSPELLAQQLGLLVARGYKGATFTEAVTAPPYDRTLAVTFDDSYVSILERAAPVLERAGVPGTVFVPTDCLDSGRPIAWEGMDRWVGTEHEPELHCMTTSDLTSLRDVGWEVGSHTCSHPKLPQVDDDALVGELTRSKAVLEDKLGAPCTSIAYPYGAVDERVVVAASAAGYEAGAAMDTQKGRPDPHRWPRVGAYGTDSLPRFRLKVSRMSRRLRLAEARTEVLSAFRR